MSNAFFWNVRPSAAIMPNLVFVEGIIDHFNCGLAQAEIVLLLSVLNNV